MAYSFDSATRAQLQERHLAVLRGEAGGDAANTLKVEDFLRKHSFAARFQEIVQACGFSDNPYGAVFAVENLVRKGHLEWSVDSRPDGSFEWSVVPHLLDDVKAAQSDPYPCTLPLGEDDRIYMNANPYRIAELDRDGKIAGIISLTGSRYGAAPMPMGMSGWIPSGTFVVQRMVGRDLWLSCDVITSDRGKVVAVRDLIAERLLQQTLHRSSTPGREIG